MNSLYVSYGEGLPLAKKMKGYKPTKAYMPPFPWQLKILFFTVKQSVCLN